MWHLNNEKIKAKSHQGKLFECCEISIWVFLFLPNVTTLLFQVNGMKNTENLFDEYLHLLNIWSSILVSKASKKLVLFSLSFHHIFITSLHKAVWTTIFLKKKEEKWNSVSFIFMIFYTLKMIHILLERMTDRNNQKYNKKWVALNLMLPIWHMVFKRLLVKILWLSCLNCVCFYFLLLSENLLRIFFIDAVDGCDIFFFLLTDFICIAQYIFCWMIFNILLKTLRLSFTSGKPKFFLCIQIILFFLLFLIHEVHFRHRHTKNYCWQKWKTIYLFWNYWRSSMTLKKK